MSEKRIKSKYHHAEKKNWGGKKHGAKPPNGKRREQPWTFRGTRNPRSKAPREEEGVPNKVSAAMKMRKEPRKKKKKRKRTAEKQQRGKKKGFLLGKGHSKRGKRGEEN